LINLTKDVQIKNELLQFLKVADFNITDIKVRNVPDPLLSERAREILKKTAPDDYESLTTSQEIYTSHTLYNPIGDVVGEEEFPLSQESRGTQKIFLIALSIINAQINGNGKTLLFDEFDDSLHFELSNALIELFNSAENRNQFILTTHELQLLDAPLRVDQIYLIEKDFQGVSSVKSIFDFNDSRKNARRDISFMRNYMQGRFGAIPQVDTDKMRTSIGMKTN
jgi:AAA15 family ATPase/GTPase